MKPEETTEGPLAPLPRAIWMDGGEGFLPDCYHGTPLDMVREMGAEMAYDLGVHEVIDFLLLVFEDTTRAHIVIPDETTEDHVRCHFFISALLAARIAKPMPQA